MPIDAIAGVSFPSLNGANMTVAALSTARISQQIPPTNSLTKSQQAWQTLQQSLASGNLAAAQSSFSTYQQSDQSLSSASSSASSASTQSTTQITALGNALSSGDLSGAQTAFANVQVDLQGAPAQATAAATAVTSEAAQRVDDLLTLSDSSSFSPTPADPTTAMEDGSYGVNTSPNIVNPASALVSAANGVETIPNSEDLASISGNGAIESSTSSRSSASVNTYA